MLPLIFAFSVFVELFLHSGNFRSKLFQWAAFFSPFVPFLVVYFNMNPFFSWQLEWNREQCASLPNNLKNFGVPRSWIEHRYGAFVPFYKQCAQVQEQWERCMWLCENYVLPSDDTKISCWSVDIPDPFESVSGLGSVINPIALEERTSILVATKTLSRESIQKTKVPHMIDPLIFRFLTSNAVSQMEYKICVVGLKFHHSMEIVAEFHGILRVNTFQRWSNDDRRGQTQLWAGNYDDYYYGSGPSVRLYFDSNLWRSQFNRFMGAFLTFCVFFVVAGPSVSRPVVWYQICYCWVASCYLLSCFI